jgi:gas vesicle protein
MGQDPDTIRREIEETRERMSDTVEALGYKADVPARTKEKVSDKVQGVKEKITGATDSVTGRVSGAAGTVGDATPSGQDIKQTAQKGVGLAQENPLGLAIGSIAFGFLAGMLIPETRVEHEKLGPAADQVKSQVQDTAQEALQHGKQVAQEVASTAQESVQQAAQDVKDTAQQSAQEHGQQAAQTAQENAKQGAQQAKSQVSS